MRITRIVTIVLSVIVINCLCIHTLACSAEYFIQQQKTTEILKLLTFSDNECFETSNKWDNFLKIRNSRFDNNDYQMAIEKLKNEYDKSYESLDNCIEDANKVAKQYSSTWINDMRKRFKLDYLQENMDSIKFIILAIWMRNNTVACEDQVKDTLYREYRHLDAAKYYVKEFIEFSDSLNKEEKHKIKAKISAAENYIKDFEYPLQSTFSDEGLKKALFSVAIKTHKGLDPQLIDFFSQHPFFKKPFHAVKALDELKSLR